MIIMKDRSHKREVNDKEQPAALLMLRGFEN